jgi:hypothetical protein
VKEAVDILAGRLNGCAADTDPTAMHRMQDALAAPYFSYCGDLGHVESLRHLSCPPYIAGDLLKESVDDLEWPGGSVVVKLTRDPAAIGMVARGTGSLEVRLRTKTRNVY